jgi:HEAT repeat protein
VASARVLLLLLALAAPFGCAGAASPVRRAVAAGDVPNALRLYDEYVDERGDGDPDLLAEVALGVLRDAAASADPRVRPAGFAALRGIGVAGREALEQLATRPGVVGDRALAAIFEQDGRRGRTPARLRAALRSDDTERRVAAMVTVRGRTAIQRLAEFARDREPLVRAAAVRELARRRGVAAAAAVLTERAHDDADPTVRAAAVMALGAQGEAAAPAIAAALQDRDPIVRMAAPAALVAAIGDAAAATLVPLLTETPSNLAVESARVLVTRGHHDAEAYVLRVLADGPAALRAQAAVAAASLAPTHGAALAPFLADRDPEVAIRVGAILVRRDEYRTAAIEALRPLAARPDGFVAVRALGALANAGDPWALDPVRQALTAPDATVRRLAAMVWPQAIGPRGSDCDALAPLLRDTDRSVALLAAMQIIIIAAR